MELTTLYQEIIIDHGTQPRNFGVLPQYTHTAEGHNTLCGDQLCVYLRLNAAEQLEALQFTGRGCAIFTASASLMTEILLHKSLSEAQALSQEFKQFMVAPPSVNMPLQYLQQDCKLCCLASVKAYPMRVKCATLPWHTFEMAIAEER
jgi:nitrogen fixation NifU-like protein